VQLGMYPNEIYVLVCSFVLCLICSNQIKLLDSHVTIKLSLLHIPAILIYLQDTKIQIQVVKQVQILVNWVMPRYSVLASWF